MVTKLLIFLLVGSLVFPGTAMAYVDPGSGSVFLQVLIAGLLGLAFTARLYWNRFSSFLKKHLLGKSLDPERPCSSHEEKD